MSKSRRSQHNGEAIVVKYTTLCLCVSVLKNKTEVKPKI